VKSLVSLLAICHFVFAGCKNETSLLDFCNTSFERDLIFEKSLNLTSLSNYKDASDCSSELSKPLLLIFYTYGSSFSLKRTLERQVGNFTKSSRTRNYIKENFILATLPVDQDDAMPLDKTPYLRTLESLYDLHSPTFKSNYKPEGIRTIGNYNIQLQIALCQTGSQPLLVIRNNEGDLICLDYNGVSIDERESYLYKKLKEHTSK